jgi:hypothetical protein
LDNGADLANTLFKMQVAKLRPLYKEKRYVRMQEVFGQKPILDKMTRTIGCCSLFNCTKERWLRRRE